MCKATSNFTIRTKQILEERTSERMTIFFIVLNEIGSVQMEQVRCVDTRLLRLHGHHLSALGCSGCKGMPSVVESDVERAPAIHILLEFCCKDALTCDQAKRNRMTHQWPSQPLELE